HRRLRDRPHAAASRRLPGQDDLQRAGAAGARLESRDELPRGRAQVRRMGPLHDPAARPDSRQASLAERQRTRRRGAARRRRPVRAGCGERPPGWLVLPADIGEGHDLPARVIKADLDVELPEATVEIDNGLEAMGKLLSAVVRGGSRFTFRWANWLFDIQYWLITKFAPTRWLAHHLMCLLGARGLVRLVAQHDPDVVISTYPGTTAVLGMLRENRRLTVPVQSAITDLAGLRYWVHSGVDMHYVTHPESIEE